MSATQQRAVMRFNVCTQTFRFTLEPSFWCFYKLPSRLKPASQDIYCCFLFAVGFFSEIQTWMSLYAPRTQFAVLFRYKGRCKSCWTDCCVGRSCWIIRRNSPGIANGTDTLGSFRQLDVRKVREFTGREKECECALMNGRGEQSVSLTKNCDRVMILACLMLWNPYCDPFNS